MNSYSIFSKLTKYVFRTKPSFAVMIRNHGITLGIAGYWLTHKKLPYHIVENIIHRLSHYPMVGARDKEGSLPVHYIVANGHCFGHARLTFGPNTTGADAHKAICDYFNLNPDSYVLTGQYRKHKPGERTPISDNELLCKPKEKHHWRSLAVESDTICRVMTVK